MSLTPGQILNSRYRIGAVLGRGGMGIMISWQTTKCHQMIRTVLDDGERR